MKVKRVERVAKTVVTHYIDGRSLGHYGLRIGEWVALDAESDGQVTGLRKVMSLVNSFEMNRGEVYWRVDVRTDDGPRSIAYEQVKNHRRTDELWDEYISDKQDTRLNLIRYA